MALVVFTILFEFGTLDNIHPGCIDLRGFTAEDFGDVQMSLTFFTKHNENILMCVSSIGRDISVASIIFGNKWKNFCFEKGSHETSLDMDSCFDHHLGLISRPSATSPMNEHQWV